MNILITGALGHIGSRLIRDLSFHFPESRIVMVDNLMTQRYCSLFDLPEQGKYQFIEGDITKLDLASLLIGVDVVVHLAAITDAAGSFNRAEEVEQNNFNATRRMAEACAEHGVRLIALSSTSVYGTQADVVDEACSEDELKPQSPYATTKLKEEKLVRQLVKEQGLKAVIFRFGTIFGVSPGMRFHTAVNKFCWQSAMGLPITVWRTALHQKRPYLSLNDAVGAIVHVIRNDMFVGDLYNVLTLNATVNEIISVISKGVPDIKITYVDSEIMNQLSYCVSNEKFVATGYEFSGDLGNNIHDTLNLLKRANSAKT